MFPDSSPVDLILVIESDSVDWTTLDPGWGVNEKTLISGLGIGVGKATSPSFQSYNEAPI